jgi:hypothetical protein
MELIHEHPLKVKNKGHPPLFFGNMTSKNWAGSTFEIVIGILCLSERICSYFFTLQKMMRCSIFSGEITSNAIF